MKYFASIVLTSALITGCASTNTVEKSFYEASILEEKSFDSESFELGLIDGNVVLWTGAQSHFTLNNVTIIRDDALCSLELATPRSFSERDMISLFTLEEASKCIPRFSEVIAIGKYQGKPYGISRGQGYAFRITYSVKNRDSELLQSIPVYFR